METAANAMNTAANAMNTTVQLVNCASSAFLLRGRPVLLPLDAMDQNLICGVYGGWEKVWEEDDWERDVESCRSGSSFLLQWEGPRALLSRLGRRTERRRWFNQGRFFRERANEKKGYFRKIAIPRSPAIAHAFLYEEKSEIFLHLLLRNGGSNMCAVDTYILRHHN
jgi:hypothetical protein